MGFLVHQGTVDYPVAKALVGAGKMVGNVKEDNRRTRNKSNTTMRFILVVFTTIAMFIAAGANAQQQRTGEQVAADLKKAARVSVKVYRGDSGLLGGMAGLIGNSMDCYKQLAKFKYYCLYLDIAARRIDELGGAGIQFPRAEYFDDEQFGARVGELFIQSNMNQEQANEYLSVMTPIINKLVEEEARKKR